MPLLLVHVDDDPSIPNEAIAQTVDGLLHDAGLTGQFVRLVSAADVVLQEATAPNDH